MTTTPTTPTDGSERLAAIRAKLEDPEIAAELAALKAHPSFGPIAEDAFETWLSGMADPGYGNYGIKPGLERAVLTTANSEHRCCVLGAAVLGKRCSFDPDEFFTIAGIVNALVQDQYDLSIEARSGIARGFDMGKGRGLGSPAFEYGSEYGARVRAVVEKLWGPLPQIPRAYLNS